MTLLRRVVLFALATASMLVGIAAGQKSVNERLDHALADLKANRLDSAEALLRPVLDSATRATTEERAAAWFLAGVIAFYQSDDSGSAADFRAALSRTLMLNGEWLKGLDPHKHVTLELGGNAGVIVHSDADLDHAAARIAFGGYYRRAACGGEREAALAPAPSPDATLSQVPRLLNGPLVHYPEGLRMGHVTGRVLLSAILDTTGRVDARTVKVLESPHRELTREARRYLEAAAFAPARMDGRAVRVCIELPVDFRIR